MQLAVNFICQFNGIFHGDFGTFGEIQRTEYFIYFNHDRALQQIFRIEIF